MQVESENYQRDTQHQIRLQSPLTFCVEEEPQTVVVADTLVDSLQNNIDSLNLNAEPTEVLESDEESDNE